MDGNFEQPGNLRGAEITGEDEVRLQDAMQGTGSPAASSQALLAQSNVVILPPGSELGSLESSGDDLVIILADGTRIVVPDGAIIVPQIVVDGVTLPAANVAALLVGNEPEPAGGPAQSSGGNFSVDPGDIQDAYGLGDLLPYTELFFPEQPEREVLYPLPDDEDPDIVIETPDNPAGVENATVAVDESGLPARDGESEGSNAASDAETTVGTIVYATPDGFQSISINGVEVTEIGQQIQGEHGVLTITSISPNEIGYSYTLTDNLLSQDTAETFQVIVREVDGDTATASLEITVIDDAPIARDDVDTVAAGSFDPVTGNIMTGEGTDTGAAGADTEGADGAVVTSIGGVSVSASGDTVIEGQYGTLTISADGSYSYVRNPGTPGGVTETFPYTLTDGDGSRSSATLTIEIEDSPVVITRVPELGEGTSVDEDGLPARDGEAPGSQQATDDEQTSGTITFTSPDGPPTVIIAGVEITGPGQVIQLDSGTLTIVDFDPVTGELDYTFVLTDNTSGDDTTVVIPITVIDQDGDTATDELIITIIDDEPEAVADSASQAGEDAPVTVDAFANDTQGADSVQTGAIAVVEGSLSGGGTVVYNGDGTFTYTPAPGEEGTVTFDYTITDGDGDTSTATVTIELQADSTPTIGTLGDTQVREDALGARDGEPEGSNAVSNEETASGTIPVTTGNDGIGSLVIDGVDVTNGGTVNGDHGVLTVTLVDGVYNYSYTLADNTLADPDSESFTLTITDSDGDSASTTLSIAIVDDVPAAADDAGAVPQGTYGPITGDVMANDVEGADGAVVTSVTGAGGTGAAGTVVQGDYGTLTIAADGSYSYTRDPGTPGGVTDTFSYTITDGDGDTSTANLVISIADSGTTLELPVVGNAGTEVEEDGLDGPPNGADAGSQASTDSESTSGTITYSAPDGPASVTIGGVAVTAAGQTIAGAYGTLTIDSIADGVITYTYELTTNTSGDATSDDFAVVVTDQDGDTTSGTLSVAIVDDVPSAADDFNAIAAGQYGPVSGNVLANDTAGADAASVVSFSGAGEGLAGTEVQGLYGKLTLNADGSYSYTRDPGTPGGVTDVFTYVIEDGDGDQAIATLNIDIADSGTDVQVPGVEEPGTIVFEGGLDGPPAGAAPGSFAASDDEFTSGTITFAAPDGPAIVTIDGVEVTAVGQVFTGTYGTLTIDSIADGVITYTYELTVNTSGDATSDDFEVVVTDQDGDASSATLVIDIVDDRPAANADVDSVTEDGPLVADGNVITGAGGSDANASDGVADVPGADGAVVSAVSFGGTAGSVGGSTAGAYGTLVLGADGSYSYTLDNTNPAVQGLDANQSLTEVFSYTITDGDGDAATTTLTITIDGADDGITINGLDATAPEVVVDEDDLADGSSPDVAALTQTGSFTITSPDGLASLDIEGTAIFGGGVTYPVTIGTQYGTLVVTGVTPVLDGDGDVVSATVAYSYTLAGNTLDHDPAAGENSVFESLTVTATDTDGSVDTAEIDIEVVDDIPTVTLSGAEPVLQVDETDFLTDASIDFSGAFSVVDGADTPGTLVYTLGVVAGDSGLVDTLSGEAVILSLNGTEVEGRTELGGELVFTISVDAGGSVTLDQSRAVVHGDPTLDNEPVSLADNLVTLTATATDGDLDISSADLDIGANITFLDDAPESLSVSVNSSVTVDETAGFPTAATSAAAMVAFTADYGNDGPGTTTTYSLAIVGDGTTTLQTAIGDLPITLVQTAPDVISGTFQNGGTQTAFVVTILSDGRVRLQLNTGLEHNLDGDGTGGEYNDPLTLAGLIQAVVTVTDGDGDPISNAADIGGSLTFLDDGPDAVDDTDAITEDAGGTADGNVLTGVGSDLDPAGADDLGADRGAAGGAVTAVAGGTIGGNTSGMYGTLVLNADGSYSYDLNDALPAVQALGVGETLTDVFTYTITDGDGDFDTATLTITINGANDAPVVGSAAVAVSDEGLADPNPDNTGTPADTTNATVAFGTVTFSDVDTNDALMVSLGIPAATLSSGGETIVWALSPDGKTLTGSTTANGIVLSVEIDDTGAFQVNQSAQIDHPVIGVEDVLEFVVPVLVNDGTTDGVGSITVSLEDDSPTLGNLGDISIDNDPASAPSVNDLQFSAGGDGPGTVTIAADTAGLTSGGYAVETVQQGNTLVAFADANGNGVFDAGEAQIFTIAVDPTAGSNGTYTFDLIQAIDPEVTNIDIGSGSSYGVGPSNSVIVTDDLTGLDLVYVTGWLPTGGFTPAEESDWLAGGNPALTQSSQVNGSSVGWGLANNNFNTGEFLRFDFGPLDDYDGPGGYTPPGGTNIETVSYASFEFKNYTAGDRVEFVAHFSDGSTQSYVHVGGTDPDFITISAPAGTTIAWIDTYQSTGSIKLNLTDVGITESDIDEQIAVDITLTDSDGDPVTDSFVVSISDDVPDAQDDLTTAIVSEEDINAAFVLDFSGSVDNQELNQQLNAVKDAGFELFDNTSGTVTIKLVIFGSDALDFGPFASFADFASQLDALNNELGGNRLIANQTDFTDAIQTLMATYTPSASANNTVFFLSDGNPNQQTGTGGNSLSDAVAAQWQSFINTNDLNVTAIGIGNGINDARLQDVDLDGEGSVLRATDFDRIIDSLIQAVAPPIAGNVLDNDTPSTNGIEIQSITVGSVQYTWDGASTITLSSGGTIAGTAISVATPLGGTLDFDFATGEWGYEPPLSTSPETEAFQYSVADTDGDVDSAVLAIDVAAITKGSNFVRNDEVITNAGGTVVIPQSALLANDETGVTYTALQSSAGASSVSEAGGSITFVDDGTAGGSFIYEAVLGSESDLAFVTVNRLQAGETNLDGTSSGDILIGRDGANDVLIGNGGADVMIGGTGADTFAVNDGDSRATVGGSGDNGTISGYDTITDFNVSLDTLNFPGPLLASANYPAGRDGTNSTLTVDGSTIKSHTIVNGIVTFDDSNTFGTALTLSGESDLAAAVQYIQANNWGAANSTIGFVMDGSTYIYHQTGAAPNASLDSLVKLEGVVLTNLNSLLNNRVQPVVLDLDGDGVEFIGIEAGVTYDYGQGEVSTAWVGADDGLLARITGFGLDIVFSDDVDGANTDLEGIALAYDQNGDHMLTAADAAWSSFVIWQDADSDGVADAGEVRTLDEMGIVSIGLVSDGQAYSAANDDVVVYGEATYATNDNGVATLADSAFATAQRELAQTRTAEQIVTAAAAGALLAGMEAAAAEATGFETGQSHGMPRVALPQEAARIVGEMAGEGRSFDAGFDSQPFRHAQDMTETRSLPIDGSDALPIAASLPGGADDADASPFDTQAPDAEAPAGRDAPAFDLGGGMDAAMMDALLITTADAPSAEVAGEPGADVGSVVADALAGNAVDDLVDAHAGAGPDATQQGGGGAESGVTHVDLAAMVNGDAMAMGLNHSGVDGADDLAALATV